MERERKKKAKNINKLFCFVFFLSKYDSNKITWERMSKNEKKWRKLLFLIIYKFEYMSILYICVEWAARAPPPLSLVAIFSIMFAQLCLIRGREIEKNKFHFGWKRVKK
jgi:hypothetical protein